MAKAGDVIFRGRIDDPRLQQLYRYWRALFRGKRLPARDVIDPTAIGPAVLPFVVLADVVEGGQRVRYRLVGTRMVAEWGADFTGRFLDEIMTGSYREFLEGLFADVIAKRCAVLSESAFRWDIGGSIRTCRLFMPLAADGRTVDAVLIGQVFDHARDASPPRKVVETRPGHVEIFRLHEAAE
ncbi:MAG: PAS domain-containing protein [Alphaproteobacteria bacterium]|nr:PAS domain-containing protein [Alphaproteobacteria bacterium]